MNENYKGVEHFNVSALFLFPNFYNLFLYKDKLFHQEAQIMRDLYAKESCIIIGRLSDYVLHDEPDVLSVFIYAPENFRIDNIMKKHHISAKEAKKLVRKMEL